MTVEELAAAKQEDLAMLRRAEKWHTENLGTLLDGYKADWLLNEGYATEWEYGFFMGCAMQWRMLSERQSMKLKQIQLDVLRRIRGRIAELEAQEGMT